MYFNPDADELETFNAALRRTLTPHIREQMAGYCAGSARRGGRTEPRARALSLVLARDMLDDTMLGHCFVRPELTLSPTMARAAAERELAALICAVALRTPRPAELDPPIAS